METGTREVLKLLEKMDFKKDEMKEKFEEGMTDLRDEIDGLKTNIQGKVLRIACLESELSATKSQCPTEYRFLNAHALKLFPQKNISVFLTGIEPVTF